MSHTSRNIRGVVMALVAALTALLLLGCNVSPIPIPLPNEDAAIGLDQGSPTADSASQKDGGGPVPDLARPDMPGLQDAGADAMVGDGGNPDAVAPPDGSPGDGLPDAVMDGAAVPDTAGGDGAAVPDQLVGE